MQPDGTLPPEDSFGGGEVAPEEHPFLQRFLGAHRITSPEEFTAALPARYRERFVVLYGSEATGGEHGR